MAKKQFQWVRDAADGAGDEETESARTASRSARKREADRLDALVRSLLELQPHQWRDMPLSAELRAALDGGRSLKSRSGVRGALRRHLLHIAALLRREDASTVDDIEVATHSRGGPSEREVALMQVERWRERILAERDRAIDELLEAHPEADRRHLRQLAMAADKERREGRSPRAARQLFAALREVFGV